jgi:Copper type II ascorbate-dependent monooxygenase, C-terminal domain
MNPKSFYALPLLLLAMIACDGGGGVLAPEGPATAMPQAGPGAGATVATWSSASPRAPTAANASAVSTAGAPAHATMNASPSGPTAASGGSGAMASAAMGGSAAPAPAPTAAAASPSGPAGLAVDPATGELVFRTEPITIEAGGEAYTCFGATLLEDMVVDGFSKTAQPFVHHAQFFEALIPEPEGISVCKEQFKLTWLPIFLAGNGASEMRFDEGIGHVIGAGTQLVLQMHLFNATDEKGTQQVEIRMHRASSPDVTPVAPWAIGSSQIHIPPRSVGKAENVCTMNGPVNLVAVFPHMHMAGRRLNIEVGKSMDAMKPLYTRDPFNFDDQRMEKTNIFLDAGDILHVSCDFTNTTDRELTFGESSTDEMCFFVGFAVGEFPSQADCPNLWDALFSL